MSLEGARGGWACRTKWKSIVVKYLQFHHSTAGKNTRKLLSSCKSHETKQSWWDKRTESEKRGKIHTIHHCIPSEFNHSLWGIYLSAWFFSFSVSSGEWVPCRLRWLAEYGLSGASLRSSFHEPCHFILVPYHQWNRSRSMIRQRNEFRCIGWKFFMTIALGR